MSRSNPVVSIVNPATKFLEWDSETSQFKYWDKQNKKNIFVSLPAEFYVLDILFTVKGFSKKHQQKFWSNEVKNRYEETVKVCTKDKAGKIIEIAEGIFGNDTEPGIRDIVDAAGGKVATSVYAIMLNKEEEYEIVNFQFKGGALGGWINFIKDLKLPFGAIPEGLVICNDFTKEKNGATKYTVPIFTMKKASEEGNEAAITADIELQEYLQKYFSKTSKTKELVEIDDSEKEDEDEDEDEKSDLPF